MWILQYEANEYNQQGFYSTTAWVNKPTLAELAGRPLEELDEAAVIRVVNLHQGKEIDRERLIETEPNGTIPY